MLRHLSASLHRLTGYRSRLLKQTHHVQTVYIIPPRPPVQKTAARTAFYAFIVFNLALRVWPLEGAEDPKSKKEDADDASKNVGMVSTEEVAQGEEAAISPAAAITGTVTATAKKKHLFIPLTLAKEVDQGEFKDDDPELPVMYGFAFDYPRQQAVKQHLAHAVGKAVARYKGSISADLGRPLQIDQYWFEFYFPHGPPPEYEISGLEITGSTVRWSTKAMQPENYMRLQRAIWPTAVFTSTVQAMKALYLINERRVTSWMGRSSGEDDEDSGQEEGSDSSGSKQAAQGHYGVEPAQDENSEDSPPEPAWPLPPADDTTASSAASTAPDASPADDRAAKQAKAQALAIATGKAARQAIGQDHRMLVAVFFDQLGRSWVKQQRPRKKNTVPILGEVQVVGPTGILCVDVEAVLNVEKNAVVSVVASAGYRSYTPRKPKNDD